MILLLALHAYPIAYMLLTAALARIPAELEEAARACGAGSRRALAHITLPLLRPALISSFVLVTVSNLADFGIPALVGAPERYETLATIAYRFVRSGTVEKPVELAACVGIVLLLDEALSALDEPLRASLRAQLQSMSKRLGLTVLHVTHDRAEALAVADRIVVLHQGRIQQIGRPDELMERPTTGFVAQFLQDAVLLHGELGAEGFRCAELKLQVPRERISQPQDDGSAADAGGSRAGVLAVAPHHVVISPAEGDDAQEAQAEVVSSLYGRHAHEVEVSWAGNRLRGETVGWRPVPGERVRAEVNGGVFFSGGDLDEQTQGDHDQAPEDPQGDGESVQVPLGHTGGSQ